MSQLAPSDVVPELRHDLVFAGGAEGLGEDLLQVTNAANGEELRLRGFEFSLARMLDGHRTAGQVVEAAGSIGLPLTLGGLRGFVRKLQSLDLIDGKHHVSASPSPWDPRERWDEQTRRDFREALRQGRIGHLELAVSMLDRVLDHSPQLAEAQVLRERLEAKRRSAPNRTPDFLSLFADAERHWFEEVRLGRSQRRGRYTLLAFWLAVGAIALLALGATVVPFPHTVRGAGTLAPIASARVVAPRTGTVSRVQVVPGQRVAKHELLFSLDAAASVAALEQAVERLEQSRREAAKQRSANDPARERVREAEVAEATATRRLDAARRASGDPLAEGVTLLSAELNRKLAELQGAQLDLELRQPDQQLAAARRLEAEVRQLELELVESDVRAPMAGEIAMVEVRPGQPAFARMEAVRIDDRSSLKLVAALPPEEGAVEVGTPAKVISSGRLIRTTVAKVTGQEVELLIDNRGGSFEPGPARVELPGRPRPLIQLRQR